MIFLNELDDLRLYKRQCYLPIRKEDKRRGSSVFLLTPNYESSKKILNSNMLLFKYFESYFIEKDITYYINQESMNMERQGGSDILLESFNLNEPMEYVLESNSALGEIPHTVFNEAFMRTKEINGSDIIENLFVFPDVLTEEYLLENKANNALLRKILYAERLRTPKEVFAIYNKIKEDVPYINKTYISLDKYKKFNMIIDLYFYNESFFRNNIYKLDKGINLYADFLSRLINDRRLDSLGYESEVIIVPIDDWKLKNNNKKMWLYTDDINPVSIITRLASKNPDKLKELSGKTFVFTSSLAYFKMKFDDFDIKKANLFLNLIRKLINHEEPVEIVNPNEIQSREVIKDEIIEKIENSQKIKIDNLTGDSGNADKDALVNKIDHAAALASDVSKAEDILDTDHSIAKIIAALAAEESDTVKLNASRTARIEQLNKNVLDQDLNGVKFRDLLNTKPVEEIPPVSLNIDSIDQEWNNLTYINFEKCYNVDSDISQILYFLGTRSMPVAIREIKTEDTSTSEDWIITYTVACEDGLGQRFTLKFDIPKIKNKKFLMLRGNDKTINAQLVQIPIMKTDEDTVQIVSDYNKIFIRRFGTTTGKSFVTADKIIKGLKKLESKKIKIEYWDNSKVCSKYNLPIDYIDMASVYNTIETSDYIIYFNQDTIRSIYETNDKKGIPYAYNKTTKEILYYNSLDETMSQYILYCLMEEKDFSGVYSSTNRSTRYTYSKASILNTEIPVIVILGYSIGLINALDRAKIKYNIVYKKEKRPWSSNYIKFKDGYIKYTETYSSSLLLNGLMQCDTENYSLAEINSKPMWLDFLDMFGGRIRADGLDNFMDLMIDPITKEVLEHYKLPTDYIDLLIYANNLLEDNKYVKHTDMNGRRIRSNEIIAGAFYKAISKSYADYRNKNKRTKAPMTIKQSAVIDELMALSTTSDLSILNPLLEVESANSISAKGLSGMNSDRAYSLDKRNYDDSMLNVLALSTGFAGNVGITRQATIDMNIEGKRGYIKTINDPDKLSTTKTLCITEALTTFGTTRDDPFRSAMTFIQTSKHGMRTKKSNPRLITNGADEALPYIVSDTFAYKSKMKGKVVEKTDDYMIITYNDGESEIINLSEDVKKNSNGGFYTAIKLDTDLKVGSTFKENQILAYDKLSFSNKIATSNNIAYNTGILTKIAIINTDEGYEDSTIISEWLSDAMSSEVIVKQEVVLPKNTNIINMIKKGQYVQEGDPLIVFQNAFDDNDINILLKNLNDEEDSISELGHINIKAKNTGIIDNIKILRTVDKEEISESIKKQINIYEKPIKERKKIMEKYKIPGINTLDPDYKLPQTGKLKNVEEGVMIEFYIKYDDKMSIGDKLINDSALKGVVKDIFEPGKEPTSEFRPDEKIHSLLAIGSINGRMVCSVEINCLINKILIELDRKIKDKLDIPFKYLENMK